MPFIGNKPSAVPLTSADIADGIITSAKIVDGTIVNADINASAAIVSTKLSGITSPAGFRNKIINGDMIFDQRNNGASYSAVNGTYSLDRWSLASYTGGATTGKFTVQQNAGSVTPPTGFTKYLGITSSTTTSASATDIYTFSQIIEGNNIADLLWGTANAKSVTLSFWIRSSTTGTFGGNIRNQNGDRSYPFTYTISSANTWEKKTITIAGETTGTWQTDISQGIYIWFNIQVGSNFTLSSTGAWQSSGAYGASGCTNLLTSSGATLYITGVQLEAGTTASDFEFLPYDVNLLRCQRYYQKTTTGIYRFQGSWIGLHWSGTAHLGSWGVPTELRTDATVGYAGSFEVFGGGGTGSGYTPSGGSKHSNGYVQISMNGTQRTSAHVLSCYSNSSSTFVSFDAEL